MYVRLYGLKNAENLTPDEMDGELLVHNEALVKAC